mmetsp:Transcript_70581/g.210476  ORF Transcript_70581/g.210476 Transcript_70581/m.210476 type:complete len:108 (+) Transcript_70581:77-400(+)
MIPRPQLSSTYTSGKALQRSVLLLFITLAMALLLLCPNPPWQSGGNPHEASPGLAATCEEINRTAAWCGREAEGEVVNMLTLFVAGILTKGAAGLLSSNQLLWATAA